ncbi:Na+/H+ antiporter subunit E [Variovorax sp. J22P271]|uniref:Na+/H+ antiporter subunit E n=1 Tax=Variovorax davisae TaxID=3053515 RepID=UPI00257570A7|nr:Na+/H+ antiporter subunit E [Variovorax sp. J22P271]MDM0031523.1 Na+/H+ antiporter subunit E [Variovorax sp. J22P271]
MKAAPSPPSRRTTALVRGVLLFVLWLLLMPSAKPADLAVGLIAVLAGTFASMRLLPPEAGHLRLGALLGFLPHFLWQSVLAGVDVARRALSPRMPLKPGFIVYRVGFRPGLARNEFASITSLLPGSVPVGDSEHSMIYHCLDIDEPVAEQMAAEEQRLRGALVAGERHHD